MALTLITAPATEPITLAEARSHCRVDTTDDDTLLAIYIGAARSAAEQRTGRKLISQTWRQTLDEFPASSDIMLLVAPVNSISAVTYVDTDGATQTIASSGYQLDNGNDLAWLLPAYGTEWPSTRPVINAVSIDIVCGGYGPHGAEGIKNWMLLAIGLLYDQRAAVDVTGKSSPVPGRFVESLLDPYIVYGL